MLLSTSYVIQVHMRSKNHELGSYEMVWQDATNVCNVVVYPDVDSAKRVFNALMVITAKDGAHYYTSNPKDLRHDRGWPKLLRIVERVEREL